MRRGALFSSVFHSTILAVLIFGLPAFVDPPTTTVVPIQIVTPEELEELKPKPEPEPKPETTAEEVAPKPEPPVEQAKLEPEPEPPKPEPEPEPEPEPPKPEAKPEPEPPPPEAVPEPEPEKAMRTPPKPRKRPEIKKAPKPDQLASILRNVEQYKRQPEPPQQERPKAETPRPVSRQASALEQNEMVRTIQKKVSSCWRLDPGAEKARDMVVEIRVVLNQNGGVQRVDILDVARMSRDGYFRSAAENARRAIFECSPFRLPPKKYQVWRELKLRFNPREMFGT